MPKILHFEDDKSVTDDLALKFARAGFDYVHSPDPTRDPVELILRERPDIIISDVTMPVMDGFEAATRYKSDARTKNIPLIFFTNLGRPPDIALGLGLGAQAYLVKFKDTADDVARAVGRIVIE